MLDRKTSPDARILPRSPFSSKLVSHSPATRSLFPSSLLFRCTRDTRLLGRIPTLCFHHLCPRSVSGCLWSRQSERTGRKSEIVGECIRERRRRLALPSPEIGLNDCIRRVVRACFSRTWDCQELPRKVDSFGLPALDNRRNANFQRSLTVTRFP